MVASCGRTNRRSRCVVSRCLASFSLIWFSTLGCSPSARRSTSGATMRSCPPILFTSLSCPTGPLASIAPGPSCQNKTAKTSPSNATSVGLLWERSMRRSLQRSNRPLLTHSCFTSSARWMRRKSSRQSRKNASVVNANVVPANSYKPILVMGRSFAFTSATR